MRVLIVFLFFIQFYQCFSQKNTEPRISCVSKNRDTLWLINDDIGRLVAKSWDETKIPINEKKPVIIIVDRLPEIRNSSGRKNRK